MNVALFGPPGSGKGTQARDVSAALGVPHVATGDIFRRHLKEGTELGRLARSYMDLGQLVPDSVTCDLVASRLSEADAAGGVLLDGFPRSVPQARWLTGWLRERGTRIHHVINLQVPDAVIIERLSGRRVCLGCGATYHVVYAPPPEGGCATCGGAVVQRKDDREEVVLERLEVYARETAPVLDVLREGATVHDIVGTGAVEDIRARIFAALSLG
jgi:adenylate kinase